MTGPQAAPGPSGPYVGELAEWELGSDERRWIERAALLSWFDPAMLGAPEDSDALLEQPGWSLLLRASDIVYVQAAERRRLSFGMRRAQLARLGSRQAMRKALAGVSPERRPSDRVQRAIDLLLAGDRLVPNALALDDLYALETIQPWFEGLLPGVPDPATLHAARRRRELLAPHEALAGRAFYGRLREREKLRGYINAVASERSAEWLRRQVDLVARWWNDHPPLIVHGPGGVGKSSLIAHFVLEHASLDGFVFVDLDFGRPCIDPRNPQSMLAEAARQIGAQVSGALAQSERVARDIEHTIRPVEAESAILETAVVSEQADATRTFVEFVREVLPDQNLPFVLDTFEEAMALGETHSEAALRLVAQLQAELPRLRPVVCSRVRPGQSAGWLDIPLAEMELTAAGEYLRAQLERRDLEDLPPALIERLIARVNRTPLALNIAVELFAQAREQGRPLEKELAAISAKASEAFLFDRLLRQIRGDDAQKLALPGLIVRRLDPDLVFEVLRAPCRLSITDRCEALALLETLAASVSLIERRGGDVFVHRPDVRRLMLSGLAETVSPCVIAAIDLAAAEYFLARGEEASRAEAAYHLLRLDRLEEADALLADPRVAALLLQAVDEVSPAARVVLCLALGVTPSDADRQASDEYLWQRTALSTAEQLLMRGDYAGAIAVTQERKNVASSELDRIAAEALVGLGDWGGAERVAERGLDRAMEAGEANAVVMMGLTLARIGFGQDRLDIAQSALERVGAAQSEAVPLDLRLHLAAARLRVARVEGDKAATQRAARATIELIDRDRLGKVMPSALREVAGELEHIWPVDQALAYAILRAALLALGFEHAQGPDLLRLAGAMRQVSGGEDGWAPAIGQLFEATVETPPPPLEAGDSRWASWLGQVSSLGLGQLLAGMLLSTRNEARAALCKIVIEQMAATARQARERKPEGAEETNAVLATPGAGAFPSHLAGSQ